MRHRPAHTTKWTSVGKTDERSQTEKATWYMSTFIGNVQRKGIHRDRKYCLPRSRAGVGEGLLSGDLIPLWGGQQVMELDRGGSSAAL